MLTICCQAEESIKQIAVFQDGWGNTGSFWKVVLGDKSYVALKVSEKNKTGEADIVFDLKLLKQFEDNVLALKKSYNPMREDGFTILETITSGDANVKTFHARMNGQKFKAIQITQMKEGQKQQHNLSLNQNSYTGLKLGIKKARKALIPK